VYKQGSVIRARVFDPQGRNPKVRPLVIVTPTAEIPRAAELVAIAITGEFATPLAPDEVELPYHPGGRAGSGLKKQCVAKCRWQCRIKPVDIIERKGYLGVAKVEEILGKLADIEAEDEP
jgi:hypothetical protein